MTTLVNEASLVQFAVVGKLQGKVPDRVRVERPSRGIDLTRNEGETEASMKARINQLGIGLRREAVALESLPANEPLRLTVRCHYDNDSLVESDLLERCRQPLRELANSPLVSEDVQLRAATALAVLVMK